MYSFVPVLQKIQEMCVVSCLKHYCMLRSKCVYKWDLRMIKVIKFLKRLLIEQLTWVYYNNTLEFLKPVSDVRISDTSISNFQCQFQYAECLISNVCLSGYHESVILPIYSPILQACISIILQYSIIKYHPHFNL